MGRKMSLRVLITVLLLFAAQAKTIADIPVQPKPEFDLTGAKACEAALRTLGAEFSVQDPIKGEGHLYIRAGAK